MTEFSCRGLDSFDAHVLRNSMPVAVLRVPYLWGLRLSDNEPLVRIQSPRPWPDGYDDLLLSSRDGDGSRDGDFNLRDGVHGLLRFDVLGIVAEGHACGREGEDCGQSFHGRSVALGLVARGGVDG